jgi:hypothetical protein
MTSDYARELGEHLDRLAALVPAKGPGSRKLAQMTPEDRRHVADKARAAKHALVKLELADAGERMQEWARRA